ncbi:MAG: HD domain-containing protein [Verrucomicrobiota bacterium]|nr:HD domain-containing protein [Verrucomicrobiota bacterium]
MELLSIGDIRRRAQDGLVTARLHAQVESASSKNTREGKPFCEIVLADACDRMSLRVWENHPEYRACSAWQSGDFVEIEGEFAQHQQFGLEAKTWKARALKREEIADLLAGPPALREKQKLDYAFIEQTIASIADPRLRRICEMFLGEFGERFRRTAAARNYHHARRGGLVEHTAQMMRAALALCSVYPQLNADLMLAGVVFHDSGKLWENHLPENGFTMAFDERGELIGHITIGAELVNMLWRKMLTEENVRAWEKLAPSSEDCRLHLLHLIASHHGEMQFGSPVFPKTPEAQALHYIDNLDARLEMFAAGYDTAKPLAERIFDRVRPLPGNLVQPLSKFSSGDTIS